MILLEKNMNLSFNRISSTKNCGTQLWGSMTPDTTKRKEINKRQAISRVNHKNHVNHVRAEMREECSAWNGEYFIFRLGRNTWALAHKKSVGSLFSGGREPNGKK